MRIPPIENFPENDQRAGWARFLEIDSSTLFRAEARGELRGIRTKTGRVIYTKAAILDWLNLNLEFLPLAK
jgi:hypothetical protein